MSGGTPTHAATAAPRRSFAVRATVRIEIAAAASGPAATLRIRRGVRRNADPSVDCATTWPEIVDRRRYRVESDSGTRGRSRSRGAGLGRSSAGLELGDRSFR